jgi:hypothetical protein
MHTRKSFSISWFGFVLQRAMNSSTCRAPARSICGVSLAIAVLFISGTARAQTLYVSQDAIPGIVGSYNATTGAVINPSLIAGLGGAAGLAITNSNPPLLLVADDADNEIGEYKLDGTPINAAFIPYNNPFYMLLSGTTLYVASYAGTEVDTYDATTGAKIKVPLVSGIGSVAGLALSGNVLYVTDDIALKVDEYDASTGVLNTSFTPSFPCADADNVLGLAVYGNHILVGNVCQATEFTLASRISEYTLTGTAVNLNFITLGDTSYPWNLLLSGSTLYVADLDNMTIGKYNAATGVGTGSFITGLSSPFGVAISSLESCVLLDNLSYSSGTLTLDFTVGNPYSDATWNTWLTYHNTIESLFSESEPITNPPKAITKTTDLSAEGEVGVLSTLTTSTQGIVCSSYQQINTGTP